MSGIKWIKINVNMTDNRKIKRIRRLPDGNNVVLFWVFLLTKAGESNKQGGLFFLEDMPYTVDDLAEEFDFSHDFVKFALNTLEKLNMIELFDEIIYIKNWEKYQNIEGMERVRRLNAERNRRYRERKKQELLEESKESDVSVTSRDGTDIELDKELDIDKEHIPYAEIIKHLNEKAGKNFRPTTRKTKEVIKARWNEGHRLDDFIKVIDVCCENWKGQVFGNGKLGDDYLQPSTLFNGRFDERLNWTSNKAEIPNYEVNGIEKGNDKHTEKGGNVQLFR